MSATGISNDEANAGAITGPPEPHDRQAHTLAAICQRMAVRLPKQHPSRLLLEQFADAISDALEAQ